MSADTGPAQLDWTDEGAPRSRRFDDIYFSGQDGLAEARAVFLEGCGLPQAWSGRTRFCVGELGFGTGLNVLALLDLWRRTRTPGQRLSIFSIEAYPLSARQAARALEAWPELADLSAMLLARWPRRAHGFHRLELPEFGASLDVAIGEAGWALNQWSGAADAWFLDGFSPAKNPQMWRGEVLAAIARRSAPAARLATFTVAGAVRRGLQQQGFAVDKRPGHGRKRERLEGRLTGEPASPVIRPRVAIIGAGIAGAALARAFSAQGLQPLVLEADAPGSGASGNPAAMVAPAVDAGGAARAAFYAQALARACDLYLSLGPQVVISQGVLQLEETARDATRFDKALAFDLFDPDRVSRPDGAETSARLGEPQARGGLAFDDGLSLRPSAVLDAWLAPARLVRARVARLERGEGHWRLLDDRDACLAVADVVCLAAGWGAQALWPELTLSPVRGQASWARSAGPTVAAVWGGYAIPFDDTLLFGATHDRGREDIGVTQEDHHRNRQLLAGRLPRAAASVSSGSLQGRAAVRAATSDFMPLAGPVAGYDGLYVLGGLGSRGFVAAPLLAEHIAALICGAPSPLPVDLQRIVRPDRFADRISPQQNRKAGA